jgi:hypothetical protein
MKNKYFDEYNNQCIILKKNYTGIKGLCLIEYTNKNKGNRYVSYINDLKLKY